MKFRRVVERCIVESENVSLQKVVHQAVQVERIDRAVLENERTYHGVEFDRFPDFDHSEHGHEFAAHVSVLKSVAVLDQFSIGVEIKSGAFDVQVELDHEIGENTLL
jgi:hypothetical protein